MKKTTLIGLLTVGLIFLNCKDKQTEKDSINVEKTETVSPQAVDATINSDTIDTISNSSKSVEAVEKTVTIVDNANTAVKEKVDKEIEKEVAVEKAVEEEEKIEVVIEETIEKTEQIIEKVIEKETEEEEVIEESIKKIEETVSLNKWVVPIKYQKMTNPEDASKANIAIGKNLYAKHCKSCHGKDGLGNGPKADEVSGELGDFSSKEFQSQADGALFYKSYIGRDDMPNYEKKMSEEDAWLVVHYLRTLN